MKKRTFILVKDFIVVDIVSVNSESIDFRQYQPHMILEVKDSNPLFIGDKIPLNLRGLSLTPIRQEICDIVLERPSFKFNEETKLCTDLLNNFLNKYNKDIVKESRIQLNKLQDFNEEVYRCFYHSMKMYYLRNIIIDIAKIMINLCSQEIKEINSCKDLINEFDKLGFSFILNKGLRDSLNCFFCMERNERNNWAKDSQILFSNYILFYKSCEFLINFCETLQQGTNIVQGERRFLNWDEAGSMCIWKGFSILRTSNAKTHPELYSKLLKISEN